MCLVCEEDILSLGLEIAAIGSHSLRKGAASELSSNPGTPQTVAVWLRAGWSLGNVGNRYIFQQPGGDQFVGRCASGSDVNDVNFAQLPPHFNGLVLSSTQWDSILPGYSTKFPPTFRCVIPFLLASLAFHRYWLKATLHSNHPYSCRLYGQVGYCFRCNPKSLVVCW
ncbi:hypothetical protein AC1031_022012 [Aphanomyces cochlioides]|nr:hypothetical protein AC1031_022012 [Aphanomyces cochlioides]